MGFVIYVMIGLLIAYIVYGGPKTKDFMRTAYINYRCDEIVKGGEPFTESTFRKMFVAVLVVLAGLAWPYLIARSIYKTIRGK